ncbi:hypothetical protein Agabi119p4_11093 [Agaricus bisporus var. burnettii]|uniref:Uncharacterized protein n=1 Tax=Agaricus bisporus var. burnettii TaxID=192524 RepID=A0A8H7C156_AGABI|nr:hypothetical protein Agabi119p4_11093 [Agaricus bisporus var. burnettii]
MQEWAGNISSLWFEGLCFENPKSRAIHPASQPPPLTFLLRHFCPPDLYFWAHFWGIFRRVFWFINIYTTITLLSSFLLILLLHLPLPMSVPSVRFFGFLNRKFFRRILIVYYYIMN